VKGNRELQVCVLVVLVGALLLFVAGGRDWVVRTGPSSGLPGLQAQREVLTAGSQEAVRALALAGVTAVGALLASRRWGRIVVGALLLAVGLAAGAVAVAGGRGSAWSYVALMGGVLLVLAGGLAAGRGRRWAALSGRYDAPAAQAARPPARPEVAAWDALDRGEDPTALDPGPDVSDPRPTLGA